MSGTQAHRAGGTRARIGRAATGVVSSAAQFGADRTDIADSMGHATAEMAGRAGMYCVVRGVGWAAGRTRRVVDRGKRGLRSVGKPKVLSEAKPSESIGKFAAKGKASQRIGKRVGAGFGKAGRGVKRMGSTGMGWMDEAGARVAAADDDFASKLGSGARDLSFKATRTGVRGVSSSARFIWRHRRAPAKAAGGAKAAGQAAVRTVRAAANFVRMVASRVVAGAAGVSLPVLPGIAVLLAVFGVLAAVMGAFLGSSASDFTGVANVPAEYEADVIRAGSICPVVTPSIIAAQIEQESNWNPEAGSPAGAQGVAQFMPDTWTTHGLDGDGDGRADILNPHDAIWTQGNYMCDLASQVEMAKKSGRLTGDMLHLALAAYNAGLGNVLKYGGIPPFTETTNYVKQIIALARAKYTSSGGGDSGVTVGALSPKLVMSDGWHVDIEAMGLSYTRFPDYDTYQCTWWAAMRRSQIGKPVDAHMGDGGQWNDTAARLGYKLGRSPKPGDVICFEPGVHGSSNVYGHVAVVEQVNSDGSILISQSGTGWMTVVTETISAADLKAMGSGVSFIH